MKFLWLPVILSIIAYLPKGHGFRIGDYLKETPGNDLQNPDEKEETDNGNTASSETCMLSFEPTESPNVNLGIPINFKLPNDAGLLAAEFNGRLTGYYLTKIHKPGTDNRDSVECLDENTETTQDLYPNKVDADNNKLNLIKRILKQSENVKKTKNVTLNSTEVHKLSQQESTFTKNTTTMNSINQTDSQKMMYLKINSTTIPLKQLKTNDNSVQFVVVTDSNTANQTNNSFTHNPILSTQTPEDKQNKFTTPNSVSVTKEGIASGQLNSSTVDNKQSFIIKMLESIMKNSSSSQFNQSTQMSKVLEGGTINISPPTQATITVPEYIKYVELPIVNNDQNVNYIPPTPAVVAPTESPVVNQPMEENNDEQVYYIIPTQPSTTEVAPVVNLFVVANDAPPEPNVNAPESMPKITEEVGSFFIKNESSTNSTSNQIISSETLHTEFGSPTKKDIVDLPGMQNSPQLPQFETPTKNDISQSPGMESSPQLPQFGEPNKMGSGQFPGMESSPQFPQSEEPNKMGSGQHPGMESSPQLPQFEAPNKMGSGQFPGMEGSPQFPQSEAPTKMDIGQLPDMQSSPQLPQNESATKNDTGGLPVIQNSEQPNLALPQHPYIPTDYVPNLHFNYDYLPHQMEGTDIVHSDSNISIEDEFHHHHHHHHHALALPLHDHVISTSDILLPDYSLYEGDHFLEHDFGEVAHSISDEVPILEHHTSSHEIHEIPVHIEHADYEDEY